MSRVHSERLRIRHTVLIPGYTSAIPAIRKAGSTAPPAIRRSNRREAHYASTPCQKDFVKFKESCYWFSSSAFRTWAQAKVYCENINAYLTTITSDEEDRFILEYLFKNA
ncbi:asialoglycoprotein receptor 1-like [Gigantopelta aegis]|uniref:asialoglycoprotein receptor 1-like n=1 Tax=Gigantopelta aegis TaxID=1735272 RepID=UPI001B888BB1|nr:asialoglycoprotein receptor 1-like [Gigantopelta aegis]